MSRQEHPEQRGGNRGNQVDFFAGLNMLLISNPTLDVVAGELRTAQPVWSNVYRRARGTRIPGTYDGAIKGALADAHVDHVITRLAQSGDLPGEIDLHPIPMRSKTTRFQFLEDKNGNLIAVNRRTQNIVSDFDNFFTAEGLPVICEVKTGKNRQGRKGYLDALKPEVINQKLEPFQEFFETDQLAYVIVAFTPPMNLQLEREQQFVAKGGVMISLPISHDDLQHAVDRFRIAEEQSKRDKQDKKKRRRRSQTSQSTQRPVIDDATQERLRNIFPGQ